MKRRLITVAAAVLALGAAVSAHRLDEYLQATLISVEQGRVQVSMRLVPGVAVSAAVIASIDANGDGVISEAEQRAYAERVLGDLSLTMDGRSLRPTLVSVEFPEIGQMQEGLGEIRIEFIADLPDGGGDRRLVLENHHQRGISAYLVNCLMPHDRDIRIVAQKRDERQSFYELDYAQAGSGFKAASPGLVSSIHGWMGSVGFASLFRLGMGHIAEGTDHLLFLLVLLLPAPLVVRCLRWHGSADVRESLVRILKVVTAFSVGHSITLALAAMGVVRVPSRPIEVLIAASILVSAAHAFRPLFPGREAGIAGFFGLLHGLAFATTLGQLGLGRWERMASILSFNLGIETMQLVVVAATMPSLVLISRTRAYPMLRTGGALFAGFAAAGWVVERLLGLRSSVDVVVGGIARHGVWIAGGLCVMSAVCWGLGKKSGTVEPVLVVALKRV